ncbi:cholesterol 25-hydroxylase-like protein 1, member 1 [Anomaloglossus baeobatrachus]|uniref:cholesterol 25-hydroxylase-like protein 1, member 1 n=1 Tax=Anomaloglossus baeobatrachus TaxID=238106 RepID=UPI003F507414
MDSSTSSQLLLLQPFWDYILAEFGGPVTSPAFPVLLAFSGFVCFSLPFAIIDILGERCQFFYQYKIQKDKQPTIRMMIFCVWRAVINHVIYVFPVVFLNWLWMPPVFLPVSAPSICTLLGEVLGCLLLFDLQYFIWHVLHHKNLWLYKKVHAIHHEYVAPFSWSSQNLSGYELMTVGFWSTMNPLQLGCHPLTSWTCNLISIWMSVDDHIGYNFPWSLHRIFPLGLYGGALAHDMHHQKPGTNFAPFFRHWDLICGTTCSTSENT